MRESRWRRAVCITAWWCWQRAAYGPGGVARMAAWASTMSKTCWCLVAARGYTRARSFPPAGGNHTADPRRVRQSVGVGRWISGPTGPGQHRRQACADTGGCGGGVRRMQGAHGCLRRRPHAGFDGVGRAVGMCEGAHGRLGFNDTVLRAVARPCRGSRPGLCDGHACPTWSRSGRSGDRGQEAVKSLPRGPRARQSSAARRGRDVCVCVWGGRERA